MPVDGMPTLPGKQSHGRNFQMNRRDMLKAGVAAGALGLAPRLASAGVTRSEEHTSELQSLV